MAIPHPRYAQHLKGHQNVLSQLIDMHRHERLPHGLLLTGNRGIGKATTAYMLAKFLLGGGSAPSNDVETFLETPGVKQVVASSHPDMFVLETLRGSAGDTSTSMVVQNVRNFVTFFTQKSFYGGWRIGIVDPVEDLNRQGANALLKLLEEPPHQTLMILITHRIDGVLDTLRSRCQMIPFQTLSSSDCFNLLQSFGCEDPSFLAQHCAGSPGLGVDLDRMGGQSFYQDFQKTLMAVNQKDLSPSFNFLETYVLNPERLDKDSAWSYFLDFLLAEVAKLSIKNSNFLPHFQPQDLSRKWFEIVEMVRTTNTFNLDRKQTLVCIFSKLAGLT